MAYVTVDGERVAEAVARDFANLDTEFRNVFRLDLICSSGTRTRQEQEGIFRSRYVRAGDVNGRRVYDTRWWNGALWYRVSSAGTVAVPGTSNHEEDGPIGPRALDVRDSGGDAGVMTRGTTRSNWLRDNAPRFNFKVAGLAFGEPWHIEWQGADPHAGVPAPQPQQPAPASSEGRPNPWSVIKGWNWRGIAAMLRRYYGYVGNNTPGPVMVRAFQRFLAAQGYYTGKIDGDFGDGTAMATQRWLANRNSNRYSGPIDAWFGGNTQSSWNTAENENWNAFPNFQQWP